VLRLFSSKRVSKLDAEDLRLRGRAQWVGLRERHPILYQLAKGYEKVDPVTSERYTWSEKESLSDLEDPGRIEEIRERHRSALAVETKKQQDQPLVQVLAAVYDDEDDEVPCFFCHS